MPHFGRIHGKRQICLQVLQAWRDRLSKNIHVNWSAYSHSQLHLSCKVSREAPVVFPYIFLPKKDIAVWIGETREGMRTHVVMPFIIFSS